jgi:hypothetical protein
MARFSVAKYVDAPPSLVFSLFTDFARVPERVTAIMRLELLTPGPIGVGTRFRESRRLSGRDAIEEMEVTAFEPGRRYDLRSRSGGTEHRSSYRFLPEGPGTRVEVDVEREPLSLAAKLAAPFTRSLATTIGQGIVHDIDDLKRQAEQRVAVV